MLAFALLACLFIKEGMVLRLVKTFAPSRVWDYVEPRQKRVSRRIFAVLKAYSGFGYALAADSYPVPALPERFLIVANHQSLLDIALIFCVFEGRSVRFVAKGSLGRGIPFVSLLLRYGGHCLVSRAGHLAATMQALDRFAARCRSRGTCPVIFPEGTRSKTGELGEFYSAGFRKLAEGSGLPIVAVALEGGHRVATVKELMKPGGAGYRVTVLPPVPAAADKHGVHEALLGARAAIEARIGR